MMMTILFVEVVSICPLSREHGMYKTVKARFWPWLAGKSPHNLFSCSLFALQRVVQLIGQLNYITQVE